MGELAFDVPEMHDSVSEYGGTGKSPKGPEDDKDGLKTPWYQESSISQMQWSKTPSLPPVQLHLYEI